jgi:hypothetical protein
MGNVRWSATVTVVLVAVPLFVSAVLGGTGKRVLSTPQQDYVEVPGDPNAVITKPPDFDWSMMRPLVGTFTTLTGFYDFQSNGGSVHQIRVNPANGNIHVTWMLSDDSTAAQLNNARRVAYAFSSDGGTTWNNFNQVRVPNRRSGFPSIDLLRGANAGLPVIASHPTIPTNPPNVQVTLFIDPQEGSGSFVELLPPPIISSGGTLEPIWPNVASGSDGSLIVVAAQNIGPDPTPGVVHYNRLPNDLSTWPPWTVWSGDAQSGGRHVAQANGTGRVGIVLNTSNGTTALGNRWIQSTNNGVTWTSPVNLYGNRVAGADTFNSYVHVDFVYNGDNPLFVFSEYYAPAGRNDNNLVFWSQATGFRIAVPHDTTKYGPYSTVNPNPQRFHNLLMNFPSIGLSGNTIVIVYQAFQPDLDHFGFNYSDLWYVASSNGGNTWGRPVRITNTPTTDERYPSISKWNAPGEFNMVWTQKTPGSSGLYAFPGRDGAAGVDTVRTFQVFLRVSPIVIDTTAVSVGEAEPGKPGVFRLSQNYPNPFNPATRIDYTVSKAGPVTIKVYNMLGQEVATLLNESLSPGSYSVDFNGATLASGVYVYRMQAGGFSESKKMLLLK